MAFALHTWLRLSEIWSLNENSIGERDGIKFIKVQTAKQKGGDVKFRELPIHKNIYRLSDMKWLAKIKNGKSNCNYLGKVKQAYSLYKEVFKNLSRFFMLYDLVS